jgi:multiple sugar transport system permease protein/putative chitobiose transport system permease protein
MRGWHKALYWTISAVVIVFFAVPYLWMAGSAFKPYEDLFKDVYPISIWTLLPRRPTLGNFIAIFRDQQFGRYMYNSVVVACAWVAGTVFISSLAAFALTRVNFRVRSKLFVFILATMLIPFDAVVVPLFQTVRALGLQDTYTGFFIPWIFSPFGIFLLKQVFEEIPLDLDEAASIDGASPFQVYLRVVLPNAVPGLVTLALISFLFAWDAFLWPLVIMSDESKQLITFFIAKQSTTQMQYWGNVFASVFVATVPVVVLFLILQRQYMRGIQTTGLKE